MEYQQLDDELYTKIMQSHPKKRFPIEQSPAWGEFQAQIPGRAYIGTFVVQKNEQKIAAATMIQLTMRTHSYIWINQGPVWLMNPTTELASSVAASLKQIAKAHSPGKKTPLFIRAHFPVQPRSSVEAYSTSVVERTTTVDLHQDFDTILARMNYGARRGMRKAAKSGFTITEIPAAQAAADFQRYYEILEETATRDGYHIHPASTYQKMLTALGDKVRFFVGLTPEGAPCTWAIVTVYKGYGMYYYGASNEAARRTMTPYLLHIEIMRKLQAEGAHIYDFFGISSKKFTGLEGVTQFKLRFGGDIVDYVPVYDVPLSSAYHPWRWAQAVRRRLHR